ncbi:hypothetical protein NMG60_11017726 [Bertholletia excelsa]
MAVDDSFKKPGAVPFKWEIRPGVPKFQHHRQQPSPSPSPSPSRNLHRSLLQLQQQSQQSTNHYHRSCPGTPAKLRPPPAGSYFGPPMSEPHARSFCSTPRTRSERFRFDRSIFARPETVAPSTGCFPTPLLRRKDGKNRGSRRFKTELNREPDYTSELETLSRRSVSTWKTLSPFRDSPRSSSFSSYQSSPRPVSDAEWAGFGLF